MHNRSCVDIAGTHIIRAAVITFGCFQAHRHREDHQRNDRCLMQPLCSCRTYYLSWYNRIAKVRPHEVPLGLPAAACSRTADSVRFKVRSHALVDLDRLDHVRSDHRQVDASIIVDRPRCKAGKEVAPICVLPVDASMIPPTATSLYCGARPLTTILFASPKL